MHNVALKKDTCNISILLESTVGRLQPKELPWLRLHHSDNGGYPGRTVAAPQQVLVLQIATNLLNRAH